MALSFNDGIEIDTSGELRILRLKDGLYVIGKGMLIPVVDENEALYFMKKFQEEK